MGFDSTVCDLCGATSAETLTFSSSSMRSDQVVQRHPLVKYCCRRCGLTHGGPVLQEFQSMYADEYATAPADYVFHTEAGPVNRSEVFTRWFVDVFGVEKWKQARRVLEVGAGEGAVLQALRKRFPHCEFAGLELSRASAAAARAAGLSVESASIEDWRGGPYDVIYSIAVLEHVPSPTAFLSCLRASLAEGGYLFLTQPTQDVPSYDILFNDHLHHFGLDHLRGYARKTGFREVGSVVGCDLMPGFSLHCWQATKPEPNWAWHGPPGFSTVYDSFVTLRKSFALFDEKLRAWKRAGRAVGVFGLSEVFALAKTYTRLADTSVRCGLDDQPEKPNYRKLGFPVVRPEDALQHGVDAVVMATNKHWLPQVESRLHRLGLETFPVLSL